MASQRERDREIRAEFRREVAKETGELVPSSADSASDSFGQRFDWGWIENEDGTITKTGNCTFTDRGDKYVPKILRHCAIPQSAWRKLEPVHDIFAPQTD